MKARVTEYLFGLLGYGSKQELNLESAQQPTKAPLQPLPTQTAVQQTLDTTLQVVPAPLSMPNDMTNSTFKNGQRLGKGAFGSVHAQEHNGELVAVKKPLSRYDAKSNALLLAEMQTLKLFVGKDNIVQFKFALENVNGYAMEIMNNGELDARIKLSKAHPFTMEELRATFWQISNGLNYIHKEGFIHRDIKPQNILFHDDGTIKIADFGFAIKADEHGNYHSRRIIGTLAYLDPYALSDGTYHYSSDVYAVGLMMASALTGLLPFKLKSHSSRAQYHEVINGKQDHTIHPFVPDETCEEVKSLIASTTTYDKKSRLSSAQLIKRLDQLPRSSIQKNPTTDSVDEKHAPAVKQNNNSDTSKQQSAHTDANQIDEKIAAAPLNNCQMSFFMMKDEGTEQSELRVEIGYVK